jgi:hypothetical protein
VWLGEKRYLLENDACLLVSFSTLAIVRVSLFARKKASSKAN